MRYLVLAVVLLSGCTVRGRREMTFTEKLMFIDDSTNDTRCYYITGFDGISCQPRK